MRKLFFVCLLFMISFVAKSQNKYVEINVNESHNYNEFDNFFSDSILDQYKVYFTGENHTFAYVNSDLEYKFLTYLNKKQHVNNFLFEQSPAIGYIMTKVTIDNDSKYKTFLKDNYAKPFYDLIINIKKYNTTIDKSNRIKVQGIDVERYPAFSIFALGKITDSLSVNNETGLIYEAIESLNSSEFVDGTADEIYNDGGEKQNLHGDLVNAWSTFETIINESDKHANLLENELGDDYLIYTQILESLKQGHKWYLSERDGDLAAPSIRERFMMKQFTKIDQLNPNSKYYGQFGRCHLHANKKAKKCYSHNMKSIANRINSSSDSTLNGRVLTIPVFYIDGQGDKEIGKMNLDDRFDLKNDHVYLIDLDYLNEDVPFKGFDENMPFVIVNSYNYEQQQKEDYFKISYEIYHLGVYTGYNYYSGISKLNFELNKIGAISFTNKFKTYTFAYDVFKLNEGGGIIAYNYIPKVSNGDRFDLKGSTFTMGAYYPAGNKFFVVAPGVNFTFGSMKLIEESGGGQNLIQQNSKNIVVYSNNVLSLDPNIDFRITLPIISFNARLGYALDVSSKYWKLDGKMKDFTKTSFTAPYFQVGLSLNFKHKT